MQIFRTYRMALVFALSLLAGLTACGGGSYSHYEKGTQLVIEGTVDNVVRSDIPHKKQIYTLTGVGFENGQGVTLVGIYPGINRGKKIKLSAEFVENINGTDLFKVVQITSVAPIPQPAAAAPANLPDPAVATKDGSTEASAAHAEPAGRGVR